MEIEKPTITNQPSQYGGVPHELGEFFPKQQPVPVPSLQQLKSIKFRGNTHLQVYHLAYGTKKLRACTYRRMARKQKQKNKRNAKYRTPHSSYEIGLKAEKAEWLSKVEKIKEDENLKATPKAKPNKKISKKERKKNANEYLERVKKRQEKKNKTKQ